jgi:hypothetical protein
MENTINSGKEHKEKMEKRLVMVPKDIRNKKIEGLTPKALSYTRVNYTDTKNFFDSMKEGLIMLNGLNEEKKLFITLNGKYEVKIGIESPYIYIDKPIFTMKWDWETFEEIVDYLQECEEDIRLAYLIPKERQRVLKLEEGISEEDIKQWKDSRYMKVKLPKFQQDYEYYWNTYMEDYQEEALRLRTKKWKKMKKWREKHPCPSDPKEKEIYWKFEREYANSDDHETTFEEYCIKNNIKNILHWK